MQEKHWSTRAALAAMSFQDPDEPGSMFRSEEMDLIEIRMPTETSHRVVYQLAASGSLMFRDLNPDQSAFQKEYASNLQRLSDIESKLHFVEKQCEEFKRPIRQMSETNTYAFDLEQTEVRVPS